MSVAWFFLCGCVMEEESRLDRTDSSASARARIKRKGSEKEDEKDEEED